jgi:hypothetical protein
MHGAVEFHVQFQLLKINFIIYALFLFIPFLLQNQNLYYAYWIKLIHIADMMSFFGHHVDASKWLLLQIPLEGHSPNHKHPSYGCRKEVPFLLLALQCLHCGM